MEASEAGEEGRGWGPVGLWNGAMALGFLVTASLLVLLRVLSPDCALWTLGWSYHFLGCVCVDMAFLQVAEKEPEDIFPSKIIKNKCK